MRSLHLVQPNSKLDLTQLPTRGGEAAGMDRDVAEKEFKDKRKELRELQYKLYAEDKRKILIVLQALDAGGKDGTIRNVFQGVNPQGVQVASFKAPTKLELAHDLSLIHI